MLTRVAIQWIAGLICVFWRGAKAGVPVSDARVLDLDLAMLDLAMFGSSDVGASSTLSTADVRITVTCAIYITGIG